MDPTYKITHFRDSTERPVVQASLGCHVPGAALPHPNPGDTRTACAGFSFRCARKIPRTGEFSQRFMNFVDKFLEKNLQPLSADADTSFETWIENTPYTQARKDELKRKYEEMCLTITSEIPNHILKVKSFTKDETYPAYKHARAINSRSDEFKCLVGPIFQLISDKLFSLPWFIKKIPVEDRPQYIIDRIYKLAAVYILSDYTSFEAHFTKEMMEECELKLLYYMVQKIPTGQKWYDLVCRAKTGVNDISFKNFKVKIQAKRMSGEMDTSLSNGFANLMFMLFMLIEICGIPEEDIAGIVEGDDGAFGLIGENLPTEEDFRKMGLTIKLVKTADLNHASFCGMVFDLEERKNVTDPIEKLVSFGWTTARYAKSKRGVQLCLLRAKALSLAYQYPGCPILSTLARKFCELTAGYDSLSFVKKAGNKLYSQYHQDIILRAHEYFRKNGLDQEPGPRTRLLVETLYGVTVQDQLCIEKYINDMTEIAPIDCPHLDVYIKPVWRDYSDRYTVLLSSHTDIDNYKMIFPATRPPAQLEIFFATR